MDCKYDEPEPEARNGVPKSGTPALLPDVHLSRDIYQDHESSLKNGTSAATNIENTVQSHTSFAERFAAAFARNKGPIDWSAARIQNDLPHEAALDASKRVDHMETENWPVLPELETRKYLGLYFTHFHHRWPILHAPTFEAETAHPVLLSCVAMIGTCIHGTSDSKELAMSLHTRVVDWIFSRLVCMCLVA